MFVLVFVSARVAGCAADRVLKGRGEEELTSL